MQPYVKQLTDMAAGCCRRKAPKVIDSIAGAKATARRAKAVMDATRAPV